MKKLIKMAAAVLTIILGALAFAGCDTDGAAGGAREGTGEFGPHGIEFAADQTLRFVYTTEATNLNPWSSADSDANWQASRHGTDTLLRRDRYEIVIPGLAYRFYMSEDGMTWHFHIRQGLQWVDHTITPVGYLTADCFVAVMEWVLNPYNMSPNTHNFTGSVLNALEFWQGEADLEDVGFRAIDRYLLEIELFRPVPYFIQLAPQFQPAYRPFLDEMGRFYGRCNESKLYIGGFVLTEFSPGFRRIWERNPYFWNAENVFLQRAVGQHNAEAALLAPELFRRGEVDYTFITSDIVDVWKADPETANIVNPGVPDHSFQWYFMFNFNPQFAAEFEPDNWEIAVNNTAFRQSIFWGINPLPALMTLDPFNAHLYLSNSITPRGFAIVDGVDFVDMEPLSRFHQYPNWLFYPERALRYRDQAIEELTAAGATFPIILYMRYNPNLAGWALEVQVVAQQLTELLGEDFIRPVIDTGPGVNFLAEIRFTGNYGFMKGNNGASPAPFDPAAWAFAFGWPDVPDSWIHWTYSTHPETMRIQQEYQALIDHAMTFTTRNLERWQAFNYAEYFLLDHAIVRPFYTIGSGYHVFRYLIFVGSGQPWEYLRMLTEPLTNEQWQGLHDDWQAGRAQAILDTPPIPILVR